METIRSGSGRLVCAIATVICFGVAHAQSGFAGKWEGATPEGRNLGLDLKVDKEVLTGTLSIGPQRFDIVDGKATGTTFSFSVAVQGQSRAVTGQLVDREIQLTVQGTPRPASLKRVIPQK